MLVPLDRAWQVFTDVEGIAPCLPGAQLHEIEGDQYRGVVKVKIGPISAQYRGSAFFELQDKAARKLVLTAEGRDTRGQGSASALITIRMAEHEGSTHVMVDTDLTIKGKVAQFGRGMIVDVSAKLLSEFVECLETKLDPAERPLATAPPGASGERPTGATEDSQRACNAESTAQDPVDLMTVAGGTWRSGSPHRCSPCCSSGSSGGSGGRSRCGRSLSSEVAAPAA